MLRSDQDRRDGKVDSNHQTPHLLRHKFSLDLFCELNEMLFGGLSGKIDIIDLQGMPEEEIEVIEDFVFYSKARDKGGNHND